MDEEEENMTKLRIVYIASLVILGVLVAFTVFRPMAPWEKFNTVCRESVIATEDEWIIEFDIINREGKDTSYTIEWSTGEESYTQKVLIRDGRKFQSIYNFYPETVKEGKVHLTIYKEGEATPFEETTYYICFDGQ